MEVDESFHGSNGIFHANSRSFHGSGGSFFKEEVVEASMDEMEAFSFHQIQVVVASVETPVGISTEASEEV